MNYVSHELAKQLRAVYNGNNWCGVNFEQLLQDVDWHDANKLPQGSANSISTLLFHVTYYLQAIEQVLGGQALTTRDAASLLAPSINNTHDWQQLIADCLAHAQRTATLLENLDNDQLQQTFYDEKYGSVYANILGIIFHMHYHMGQIVLMKKMLR